jgi:hypothetical protein
LQPTKENELCHGLGGSGQCRPEQEEHDACQQEAFAAKLIG